MFVLVTVAVPLAPSDSASAANTQLLRSSRTSASGMASHANLLAHSSRKRRRTSSESETCSYSDALLPETVCKRKCGPIQLYGVSMTRRGKVVGLDDFPQPGYIVDSSQLDRTFNRDEDHDEDITFEGVAHLNDRQCNVLRKTDEGASMLSVNGKQRSCMTLHGVARIYLYLAGSSPNGLQIDSAQNITYEIISFKQVTLECSLKAMERFRILKFMSKQRALDSEKVPTERTIEWLIAQLDMPFESPFLDEPLSPSNIKEQLKTHCQWIYDYLLPWRSDVLKRHFNIPVKAWKRLSERGFPAKSTRLQTRVSPQVISAVGTSRLRPTDTMPVVSDSTASSRTSPNLATDTDTSMPSEPLQQTTPELADYAVCDHTVPNFDVVPGTPSDSGHDYNEMDMDMLEPEPVAEQTPSQLDESDRPCQWEEQDLQGVSVWQRIRSDPSLRYHIPEEFHRHPILSHDRVWRCPGRTCSMVFDFGRPSAELLSLLHQVEVEIVQHSPQGYDRYLTGVLYRLVHEHYLDHLPGLDAVPR